MLGGTLRFTPAVRALVHKPLWSRLFIFASEKKVAAESREQLTVGEFAICHVRAQTQVSSLRRSERKTVALDAILGSKGTS